MNDQNDLEIMVVSRFSIILIATHEELPSLDLIERVCSLRNQAYFTWNVSQGLRRALPYPSPIKKAFAIGSRRMRCFYTALYSAPKMRSA